jgi:hypothetical protein
MDELLEIATEIMEGKTLPFGSCGVYDSADWIDAAQQALDPIDQDWTDMRAMVAKERAWECFATSRVAHANDWTFDEYCERMAA